MLTTYPHSRLYSRFFDFSPSLFETTSTKLFADEIVKMDDGSYKLVVEVPGYSREDVTLTAKEKNLVIELRHTDKDKTLTYRLGKDIDTDKITASCKDGLLTILLPLLQEKTKTVSINVS
jgi:HSP20 family molecular chaperone IbpA